MASLIRTDLELFKERVEEILGDTPAEQVNDTIQLLRNELVKNNQLTALCAPQINKQLRLFVVRTADKKIDIFLNPMIVQKSKEIHLSMEQNASIPNKTFIIPRFNEIHVAFQTQDGHVDSKSYKGAYAEVIQQMIEMLDGITLGDYGLDLDDLGGLEAWNKASNKEQTEVIQMYLEHLSKVSNVYSEEIKTDPELSYLDKQIKFTTKYLLGEVKPVDADGNILGEGSPTKDKDSSKQVEVS